MLSRRLLRIKVFKSLYSHFVSERSSVEASLKEYRASVDKCYDLYLYLLLVPELVVRYANGRIDIASRKLRPTAQDLNPNLRFVDNEVIAQIADWAELKVLCKERKVSLGNDFEDVAKDIYDEMIATQSYKNYMAGAMSDAAYLEKFYEELFEDNQKFEDLIESLSIFWADDLSYALLQVIKTIKNRPLELLPQWKSDDDRKFGEELFLQAARNTAEYMALVDKMSENWDLERIAISDRLLLVLAIAECLHCPSVPVKVTLDETIEISKYFSTPQSGAFVNGVLHKAIEELRAEGRIVKTGRGLVDKLDKIDKN